MNEHPELDVVARKILDANLYMTLGTADETGLPWVTPVFYACEAYREFFWVSSPEARHSRNIAARPQVSIVVFDSQAPIGTAQAVYMLATAEALAGTDLERGIDIYSRGSVARGGREWTHKDVLGLAVYRLYRAAASEHYVLLPYASPDQRTAVTV